MSREAFENWWPSVGQTIGKVAAWEAWQAAQAQTLLEVIRTPPAVQAEPVGVIAVQDGYKTVDIPDTTLDALPIGAKLYAGTPPAAQASDDWVIKVEAGQVVISRMGANYTGYLYTAPQAAQAEPVGHVTGFEFAKTVHWYESSTPARVGAKLYTTPPAAVLAAQEVGNEQSYHGEQCEKQNNET